MELSSITPPPDEYLQEKCEIYNQGLNERSTIQAQWLVIKIWEDT